jgi:hypothetical protein
MFANKKLLLTGNNGPMISKRSLVLLLMIGLVAGISTLSIRSLKSNPDFENVVRIVEMIDAQDLTADQEATEELLALGPQAYPHLARILMRGDSGLEKFYDRCRGKAPGWLQSKLPERKSKEPLRQKVAGILVDLGPTAPRALLGTVGSILGELGPIYDHELLKSLYWSLPESKKARQILEEWLSKPHPEKKLFGMTRNGLSAYAREIWPTVPEMAPLLVDWLKLPDEAAEAAAALGVMGSQAALAIPSLIEVVEKGVAGDPPGSQLGFVDPSQLDPISQRFALEALGQIGIDSPEVFATLEMGLTNAHPVMRAAAARAIEKFGPKALPFLPKVLVLLGDSDFFVVEAALMAIGRMGPEAKEAVPALRRWADPRVSEEVLGFSNHRHQLPLHTVAAIALCKIDADGAKDFAGVIVRRLKNNFPETELESLKLIGEQLTAQLLPALNEGRDDQRYLVAYHILILDPDQKTAKDLLLEGVKHSDPNLRVMAASYIWRAVGETNQTFQVLQSALQAPRRLASTLVHIEKLGEEAHGFVPELQPLLEHKQWGIRFPAGKILKKAASDALPPIHSEPLK